jgi:hypothetical protein
MAKANAFLSKNDFIFMFVRFAHEGWFTLFTNDGSLRSRMLARCTHVSRRRATIRGFATIVRAFGTTIREHGVRAIIRSSATAIIYSPPSPGILLCAVGLVVLLRRLGRWH